MQIKAQINGVDTQIAGLEARSRELRTKMDQLVKRVEATPQVEREYQQLTRDLDLARTKYDELLKSRMDSELTVSGDRGRSQRRDSDRHPAGGTRRSLRSPRGR